MARFRILDPMSHFHVQKEKDASFMFTELGMDPNDLGVL